MDVTLDESLLGGTVSLLYGGSRSLLAQNGGGFLDVAVGLGERFFTVKQPQARRTLR